MVIILEVVIFSVSICSASTLICSLLGLVYVCSVSLLWVLEGHWSLLCDTWHCELSLFPQVLSSIGFGISTIFDMFHPQYACLWFLHGILAFFSLLCLTCPSCATPFTYLQFLSLWVTFYLYLQFSLFSGVPSVRGYFPLDIYHKMQALKSLLV